jgi:hypothetical protein
MIPFARGGGEFGRKLKLELRGRRTFPSEKRYRLARAREKSSAFLGFCSRANAKAGLRVVAPEWLDQFRERSTGSS